MVCLQEENALFLAASSLSLRGVASRRGQAPGPRIRSTLPPVSTGRGHASLPVLMVNGHHRGTRACPCQVRCSTQKYAVLATSVIRSKISQVLLDSDKMLSHVQSWNICISILNEHVLFSDLRWNRSLFSGLAWNIRSFKMAFGSLRAHFISELRWNSHCAVCRLLSSWN